MNMDVVATVHDRVVDALHCVFPGSDVRVVGDEGYRHIEVYVSSSAFAGKSLVECHRMVLNALDDMLLQGTLHAVSVKTAVGPRVS